MSRAGARKVRAAELACVTAAALLSRIDPETERGRQLLDRARRLARELPGEGDLVLGASFTALAFGIEDLAGDLAALAGTEGEALRAGRMTLDGAQRQLRQLVDACLVGLHERAYRIARGVEDPGRARVPQAASEAAGGA